MNLCVLGCLDHFHAVAYLYDLFKTTVLYLFPVDSVAECNQEVKTAADPRTGPGQSQATHLLLMLGMQTC